MEVEVPQFARLNAKSLPLQCCVSNSAKVGDAALLRLLKRCRVLEEVTMDSGAKVTMRAADACHQAGVRTDM
jgi:hypothetical protein